MKLTRQILATIGALIVILSVLSCKDSSKQEPPVTQNDSCYNDRPNNDTLSIIIYKNGMTPQDSIFLSNLGLKKSFTCPCDSNLQLWGDTTGISIFGHDGVAHAGDRGNRGGTDGPIVKMKFQISPNYILRTNDAPLIGWNNKSRIQMFPPVNGSTNLIGVMDSGIQSNNLWTNGEDVLDNVDNDRNGLLNDFHGWNFIDNSKEVYTDNTDHSHGSMVTHLIERELELIDQNYRIIPMVILDKNKEGRLFNMACAMTYALKISEKANLKTINASVGYYGQPNTILDNIIGKLQKKNIMLVTAAGNADSSDICEKDDPRDLTKRKHKFYPASYAKKYSNVISVTTVFFKEKSSLEVAPNQNYSSNLNGSVYVDIGVMGDSAWKFGPFLVYTEGNNDTTRQSSYGTSLAAPIVTAYSFLKQIRQTNTNKANKDLIFPDGETKNYKYLSPPSNTLSAKIKEGKVLIKKE